MSARPTTQIHRNEGNIRRNGRNGGNIRRDGFYCESGWRSVATELQPLD